ncbi:unnamed protein product, partial [Musa textilis]
MRELTVTTRRRRTWNERTSSMGSLFMMLQAALFLKEWRHRSYVVALKVKAPPIGSFVPLRASIDLM